MSTRWSIILIGALACLLLLGGVAAAQGPLPESVSQVTLPFEGTVSTTGAGFAVNNTGAGGGAIGLAGRSDNGYAGVVGFSQTRYGVFGISVSNGDAGVFGRNEVSGIGVLGRADNGVGVWARSVSGPALRADSVNNNGAYIATSARDFSGLFAEHTGTERGYGLIGVTQNGHGVRGVSSNGEGVLGIGTTVGVKGTGTAGIGVQGLSTSAVGIYAESTNNDSLEAKSTASGKSAIYAHHDEGNEGNAIYAVTDHGYGVQGVSENGTGMYAEGRRGGDGIEAYVTGDGVAVYARRSNRDLRVALFEGGVEVVGTLSKSAGSFKIDHPLDPANQYLSHSFVESPDMMNVYNGNITTDSKGFATVTMPKYFEALNRDFRYQLTVIGQFAQAIVAEEIKDNQFVIQTDKPNVKVSWQVTGIRHDPYATAHPIVVEQPKPASERGTYLAPELYGQPDSLSLSEARRQAQPQAPAAQSQRQLP
ncbi:MAG: hypothetical protein KIT87_26790 [Anaerolineae bacterium]|nr:hypothetical protein [Anaerolineae bacterium]